MNPEAEKQTFLYDAFLSYSHADRSSAEKLEKDLESRRLPKGALQNRRYLRIFRDRSDLVGNELSPAVMEAVHDSRTMVVLCSPAARASKPVSSEIAEFLQCRGSKYIKAVLVGGRANKDVGGDDPCQDKAIPEVLCSSLDDPLYEDLRLGVDNRRWSEAEEKIAAFIVDWEVEEFRQREHKESQRRRIGRAAALLVVVALLTAAALFFACRHRALMAGLSRALAAQSTSLRAKNYDEALLLAVAACSVANTVEARASLLDDLASHPRLVGFLYERQCVWGVAVSPDGKTIATRGDDSLIVLWDVTSRRRIGEPMAVRRGFVTCLAFSPDGRTLASGCLDSAVTLWDVASRQPIGEPLGGHPTCVRSVAFSPDGKTLAAGCYGGSVTLWYGM